MTATSLDLSYFIFILALNQRSFLGRDSIFAFLGFAVFSEQSHMILINYKNDTTKICKRSSILGILLWTRMTALVYGKVT